MEFGAREVADEALRFCCGAGDGIGDGTGMGIGDGTGVGTGDGIGEGSGDCFVKSMGSELSTLGLFCDGRPPDLVRYRFAGGFGGAGFTGGGIAFGCEGSETGSGTRPFRKLLLRLEGDEDLTSLVRAISSCRNLAGMDAQMTGINRNNGRLRVSLSFATKSQFRSKTPFSQPLRNAFSQLPNECHCAAKWHSCAKFTFAIAKYPAEWDFLLRNLGFTTSVFRNCEGEFGTQVPLRSTVTFIWQLRNALRSGCKNGVLLRNWDFVAKLKLTLSPSVILIYTGHLSCEKGFKIRARHSRSLFVFVLESRRPSLRSSSPTIRSGQVSQLKMARTREAKSSSLSSRKRSLRKGPVLDPVSEPSQPKAIPPPVKPVPPKLPAKRYLTRSGGRPSQKRPRVESSEPIDLTEQFPEPSPIPSPIPTPVPSSIPMPVPSPMPSPAPQAKSQEPQPPLPEPQIPSEIAPKEVIRRPMLTQPPIEGNLDCRARAFHSELCFNIAAFRVRPELAQTFNLLRRYHMEHLLTPRDFFYP
ncbi:hypothetical protein CK203_027358 [Vitis vinifera]|uniref:Uncharacterized protein n=1 Tax=Vitis vinifera TaxID=29760 RepID=A0A438J9M0_VITVI|nr:hypothetical protein CK203_027358 [Vitis vinifera]